MEKNIKWPTCMQTSLESPWIRIPVNPFLRAYFIPNIIARYSAALFVAIPTPSRNLQIFKVKIVKEIIVVRQWWLKQKHQLYTKLPSLARRIAPAPAFPGFPFDAPSNSTKQVRCTRKDNYDSPKKDRWLLEI